MKNIFAVFILMCGLVIGLCLFACGSKEVAILSYNVDNLFDGVDNGSEYREYDPGAGKWNDELFHKKLLRTAEVVRNARPGGPDIVLLQEIENENVLHRLISEGLSDLGYVFSAAPRKPQAATTVGIMSKLPISLTSVYALPEYRGNPVREILEATIKCGEQTLIVFNNHWKSKSEGDSITESARREAAGLIARRVRELVLTNPATTIVVAGDLNECHDEYRRLEQKYQTALLPEGESLPPSFYETSLILTGRIDETGVVGKAVVFFEPWLTVEDNKRGSYYYKKDWETIDHILIMNKNNFVFKDFHTVKNAEMTDPRTGAPLAWKAQRPTKGFSDHWPVLLVLGRQ